MRRCSHTGIRRKHSSCSLQGEKVHAVGSQRGYSLADQVVGARALAGWLFATSEVKGSWSEALMPVARPINPTRGPSCDRMPRTMVKEAGEVS